MARRRGLDYEIATADRFSVTLDSFVTKVNLAKEAWRSFRREATKGGTTSASGAAKEVGRKMREVTSETRTANIEFVRMARNLRRSATAAASVATSLRAVRTTASRAATAAGGVATSVKRASLFASGLNTRLGRTLIIFTRILGVFALFRGIQAVFQVIGAAIREAVGFSSKLEDSKIGIRALVASVFDISDATGKVVEGADKFRLAFVFAEDQVRKLRIEGLKTAATFDQLLNTFQVAIAPGAQAGLPLEQIRQLAVSIAQAAAAIGVPQNQLSEEIRSLLQGTISKKNTRIATALGIENEDIENAKELGTLFEFLTEQFSQFGVASTAALANFTTRLANLKDAVGQTLSEGLAGSFQGLKDLILDITESLIDIEELKIAEPIVELLGVFDTLGREILGGLSDFVKNLDVDRLAITFQGIADSVRVMVDVFVALSQIVAPIAETFAIVFSAITQSAKALERWTGLISTVFALLKPILSIWFAVKAVQLASFLIQRLMNSRLVAQLGILTLIRGAWTRIGVAATSAIAAAGIAQGVTLASGGGAIAGVLAGATAALPLILTVVGVLSVAMLLLNKNIRKTLGGLITQSRDATDSMTELSSETIEAFLLVRDAVNKAEEAMEVLEKRFDSLDKRAKESAFLEGFTGVSRKAAAIVSKVQIEFERAVENLGIAALRSRDRVAEIRKEMAAIGVVVPVKQLVEAAAALERFTKEKANMARLATIVAEVQKDLGDSALVRTTIEDIRSSFEESEAQAAGAAKSLERLGIEASIAAGNLDIMVSLSAELIKLVAQLPEELATEEAIRESIVKDTQKQLEVLNSQLRDAARARRLELSDEQVQLLELLNIEADRAGLSRRDDFGDFAARTQALRTEFDLRKAIQQTRIETTRSLLADNADITELNETLRLQLQEQEDLTKAFAQAVGDLLVPAIGAAGKEMDKLKDASTDALNSFNDNLQLLNSPDSIADIDSIILQQRRVFDEAAKNLLSLQKDIKQTIPLLKGLGLDEALRRNLDAVEKQLNDLPAVVAVARAGLIGNLVTKELASARTEVNGLLTDAKNNLKAIQATLGKEGISRDLTSISTRISQQFSELRTGLADIQSKVINLAGAAADSGQAVVAGIFRAMAGAIDEQIARLNQGELQVLKDETRAFALDVADALNVDNKNLDRQLRVRRELNRIEKDGFINREQSSITSLKQQEARIELERDFAIEESHRQTEAVKAAAELLGLSLDELEIKKLLLALDAQRLQLTGQAAESLLKIEELLAREALRLEDPVKFFFTSLPTRAEVASARTIEALGAIRDFLIDDLSGALTDALFRDEDTLKERFQRLAESLVQIMVKEFLQNEVFKNILTFSGGGSTSGGGGSGDWTGGIVSRVRATMAHYMQGVQSFAGGGRVGSPSGPTPIGGGRAPIRPPKGIDPRDTIPAWLAPREFVMPVVAVNQYGMAVMEAMRSGRLSASVLNSLIGSTKTRSRARKYGGSSLGFAHGGPVPGGAASRDSSGVTIINATNQRDIYDAITTAEGREVVLNVVRFGRDNGLI